MTHQPMQIHLITINLRQPLTVQLQQARFWVRFILDRVSLKNMGNISINTNQLKFNAYTRQTDLIKCENSRSLIFYPSLDFRVRGGYLNIQLNFKKLFTQIRLLNLYNSRLIFCGQIYILNSTTCHCIVTYLI